MAQAGGLTVAAETDEFDLMALRAELTEDEGRAEYPYTDSLGNLTIGIGHAVAGGLSAAVIDMIFADDVAAATAALDAKVPWWRSLPANQQRVMINLCFNMGWPVFSSFARFLAAMKRGDMAEAEHQLRNSVWYTQVGLRGPRMCARLSGNNSAAATPTSGDEPLRFAQFWR